MPAAFAHITAVNLATDTNHLNHFDLHPEAYDALLEYFEYCELGSVSPDYPYLSFTKSNTKWADHMHTGMRTVYMFESGVRAIRAIADPQEKKKAFAWFCGFVSHIIADMVLHPVIELKVGPYEQNKSAHRECELHQDVYIYQRLGIGPMGVGEKLHAGIETCCDPEDEEKIDPVIARVWELILNAVSPSESFDRSMINTWHKGFIKTVSLIEETDKLLPLSRHLLSDALNVVYPLIEDLDKQFINKLLTPSKIRMDYDILFDMAIQKIGEGWHLLADAVYGELDTTAIKLAGWNLDTGRDTANQLVYWA